MYFSIPYYLTPYNLFLVIFPIVPLIFLDFVEIQHILTKLMSTYAMSMIFQGNQYTHQDKYILPDVLLLYK